MLKIVKVKELVLFQHESVSSFHVEELLGLHSCHCILYLYPLFAGHTLRTG